MNEYIEQRLRYITDMLTPDMVLHENHGLWYGKMGIAVFLFHYAKSINNKLYEDYALSIVKAIRLEISKDSARDFDSGLAGLGTGIEYLLQNRFLPNSMDVVLRDIDRLISCEIVYRHEENNCFRNGLCGFGHYLLCRLNGQSAGTDELGILFNKEALIHIVNLLENREKPLSKEVPDILSFLCKLYQMNICNPKIDRYMNRVLASYIKEDMDKKMLPVWTLTFLRLASVGFVSEKLARIIVDRILQIIESAESFSKNEASNPANWLLWLLRCKKLINQTGISIDSISRLDSLIEKILKQSNDWLIFEEGQLSLKGCVGVGLAMMTIAGQCDDGWLDLLG